MITTWLRHGIADRCISLVLDGWIAVFQQPGVLPAIEYGYEPGIHHDYVILETGEVGILNNMDGHWAGVNADGTTMSKDQLLEHVPLWEAIVDVEDGDYEDDDLPPWMLDDYDPA